MVDVETDRLRAVLLERDRLRDALAASETSLRDALDAWGKSRPGASRGKITETGARFVLRTAGLLEERKMPCRPRLNL